MTGRIHIVRSASQRYRLMFVPGGPDRHLVVGEDALRDFLLTDLDIAPGVTETALTELRTRGRYTIEDILVADKAQKFWRLDPTPKPTAPVPEPSAPEPKPKVPAPSKSAKRRPRQVVAGRTLAKPKPTRKAKRKGRSGR